MAYGNCLKFAFLAPTQEHWLGCPGTLLCSHYTTCMVTCPWPPSNVTRMTATIQVRLHLNFDRITPEIQLPKTHFSATCDLAPCETICSISLLIKHCFMLLSAAPHGLGPRICCPHRGSVSGFSLWVTPREEWVWNLWQKWACTAMCACV